METFKAMVRTKPIEAGALAAFMAAGQTEASWEADSPTDAGSVASISLRNQGGELSVKGRGAAEFLNRVMPVSRVRVEQAPPATPPPEPPSTPSEPVEVETAASSTSAEPMPYEWTADNFCSWADDTGQTVRVAKRIEAEDTYVIVKTSMGLSSVKVVTTSDFDSMLLHWRTNVPIETSDELKQSWLSHCASAQRVLNSLFEQEKDEVRPEQPVSAGAEPSTTSPVEGQA